MSDDRALLIIGAGGHAKVVIEVARAAGWEPMATFDSDATGSVLGVPIRGDDDEAERLIKVGPVRHAIVALGLNALRSRIAIRLRELGATTPTLIHPRANISPSAEIGPGTVVMPGAVVNAMARIGYDVIVNTSAIVEHDCVLGDAAHIAPGTALGGQCEVGARTLVGIGARVRPRMRIGSDVVIGAGSVVVRDIPDEATVVGNPAQPL